MAEGYTHMMIILDRTGSMETIRNDVIGGFNSFLKQQGESEGRATATLVQFDSQDPFEVRYSFRDVHDAPELTPKTYVPRASTPLLDAMGRGMLQLDHDLAKLGEDGRPKHVLFVVITDGLENASREYRRRDIVKMMEERKARGWQFVFLSADLDAVVEAESIGVSAAAAMAFDRNAGGVRNAFDSLGRRLDDVRRRRAMQVKFDEEDRRLQEIERQRMKENKEGQP